MGHGLLFNVTYTYSHSIDEGSTWHSGATTASGGAGGDGYSTDQAIPGLDRGNSVFDIRQRLVLNYVYELPGKNLHGFAGAVLGGWQYSGIWAMQTGAHWSPYTSAARKLREISDPTASCSATDVAAGNCTKPWWRLQSRWRQERSSEQQHCPIQSLLAILGKTAGAPMVPTRRDHQRMRRICESGESAGHLRTLLGMRRHLGPEPVPRARSDCRPI